MFGRPGHRGVRDVFGRPPQRGRAGLRGGGALISSPHVFVRDILKKNVPKDPRESPPNSTRQRAVSDMSLTCWLGRGEMDGKRAGEGPARGLGWGVEGGQQASEGPVRDSVRV